MQRISSNLTLFLKLVLPMFWFVFFGLLTFFILISDPETTPLFQSWSSKLILAAFYLVFAVLIYFTFCRLLRLDVSDEGLFVSNYFKTYRYKYEDIASIKEKDFLLFTTINIIMREKTSLGKKFIILINKKLWREFVNGNPDKLEHLIK